MFLSWMKKFLLFGPCLKHVQGKGTTKTKHGAVYECGSEKFHMMGVTNRQGMHIPPWHMIPQVLMFFQSFVFALLPICIVSMYLFKILVLYIIAKYQVVHVY